MGGEYIQRRVGGKGKVAETPLPDGTSRRFALDGAIVPGMLLLLGRELALYDPPRELAWQLFHDLKNTPKPWWLTAFLPHPAAVLYDDPVALLLAAVATGLAAAGGSVSGIGSLAACSAS